MESPQEKNESPKQLCTLRIVFPVDDDEAAIEVKKKITEILAPMQDAQIIFGLAPARPAMQMPLRG